MLQLIEHIIRISSKRDRTEINSAMVDAMQDMFAPSALTVYRCYPCAGCMIVFACAGLQSGKPFSHNAYLPDRQFCQPIDHDPLLQRCRDERAIVRETLVNGADRLVFPVIREDLPIYLIDILLPIDFPAEPRVLLMGLVEYFGHHIALLDYGEADTLTGLANRKTFDKHLFEVLGKAADDEAQQHPAAPGRRRLGGSDSHWLAVCDIDHFKRINDTWGHDAGDEVLRCVGRLLQERFRTSDVVARFGGEEFCVIAANLGPESALELFDGFRQQLAAETFEFAGQVVSLTISIGITTQVVDNIDTMISAADALLYRAKEAGRNRAVLA